MKKGNIQAIAQGISALLHPHAEIVLHDLSSGTIAAVFNNLSNRNAGDPSLLDTDVDWDNEPSPYGPYKKTNWDGRTMHSVSIILKDSDDKAQALLCINLDISVLEQAQSLIASFFSTQTQPQPEALFKEDWQERIHTFVHQNLRKKQKSLDNLTSEDRKYLVIELKQEGAFKAKHAAQYVASVLGVTKATIYNYLRS